MVNATSQKRLTKEYKNIQSNPPPYIIAKPNDANILEWHYVLTGPPNTPFEGGQYHGMLKFPKEYPFKPPSISMVTPNGRFATNTPLCLSMSDFHPDTWNPAWSVSTILTGLLSFMTGNESTTGSIATSEDVKKKLAKASKKWNATENTKFCKLFSDMVKKNLQDVEAEEKMAEEKKQNEQKVVKKDGEKIVMSSLDPEDRVRLNGNQERSMPGGWIICAAIVVLSVYLLK